MAQNDQALLTRLKDSGLEFVVILKKAMNRERDLAAVRYLLAIKERNEQR